MLVKSYRGKLGEAEILNAKERTLHRRFGRDPTLKGIMVYGKGYCGVYGIQVSRHQKLRKNSHTIKDFILSLVFILLEVLPKINIWWLIYHPFDTNLLPYHPNYSDNLES